MFDRIRQRLALRHRRADPADPPVVDIMNVSDGQKQLVLDQLRQANVRKDRVAIRDLHRLSGLPQPVVLRALRALEQDGLVEREENLFDALGAEVRLK